MTITRTHAEKAMNQLLDKPTFSQQFFKYGRNFGTTIASQFRSFSCTVHLSTFPPRPFPPFLHIPLYLSSAHLFAFPQNGKPAACISNLASLSAVAVVWMVMWQPGIIFTGYLFEVESAQFLVNIENERLVCLSSKRKIACPLGQNERPQPSPQDPRPRPPQKSKPKPIREIRKTGYVKERKLTNQN